MAITEAKRAYNKKYYQENRERLLAKQHAYDEADPEARRARDRTYYLKNRGARLQASSEYNKAHREQRNAQARARLSKKRDEINAYNRDWRKALRFEVLAAYGNKCECCSETELEFLEAHHKNGGGNKHRRGIGGGAKMYIWIRKHGFPPDFGLLCSNCNKAIYRLGYCPHSLRGLKAVAA